MPLAVSFVAACARGLGLGNGEAPLAPSITTPASNDTTLGTPITAAIAYTITISTFTVSYVQYKLDKIDSSNTVTDEGQWTGSLAGASGSNSATLSTRVNSSGSTENILHNQKYALYLRSVDAAGQTGPSSTVRRFTTAAESAPTAATPSISSSSVSYPTAPFLQFTWAAGTNGTYSIGTREYSVVAGNNPGAGTYTTLSGSSGTTSLTATSNGTALLPNTQYTVYLRYTASSPGSASNTAYATHTTAAEILPSAPTVSISSWDGTDNDQAGLGRENGRTQIVIARGNVPTPPTPTYLYKYQYAYGTSSDPTNWADFPTSGQASSVTISSLPNDTTYYARVRAVSLGTSTGGTISGNASGTTNPALPPQPTIEWRSMSGSSYGTAQFTIGNNGGSTTAVYIVRRPTSGTNTGATFVLKATGSQDIGGYSSDGGTEYYVSYNYNRLGEASAASASELRWTRPAKNVSKTWRGNDFGQAYYFPDYTYVIKTNACEPYRLSYLFGPSGIPDDENAPGYARVDRMQATFIPGLQLYRPSDGALFTQGGVAEKSLANVSTLRFSYGTAPSPGGTPTSPSSALPTNAFGGALSNFGGATQVYRYVTIGGSALHNKVFWAEKSDLGKTWSSYPGCTLSTSGSYFAGKLFELVGVVTVSGTIS